MWTLVKNCIRNLLVLEMQLILSRLCLLLFQPKVVHIQDPFVLDQNIASIMNKRKMEQMVATFRRCRMLVIQVFVL